jgi:hypothetical protein
MGTKARILESITMTSNFFYRLSRECMCKMVPIMAGVGLLLTLGVPLQGICEISPSPIAVYWAIMAR